MKFSVLLMSFFSALLLSGTLRAQVTTSSMTGVVKNAEGKPAVGTRVKAIHEPTGTVYTVITRQGGRFDIANMNTGGPYTVVFSGGGEKDVVKNDIYLSLGETEAVDAKFENTDIKVVGVRTARTVKTGTSSTFGSRVINTVPNISRSITNITTLTPQAGGGNSFGGRDGRFNNIQIDGANFNNNFGLRNDPLPGGGNQAISLDAIDEISVNVSPFDVRQANFTGAGINATTRKGTNTLTGSVFGFYRDQSLLGEKVAGKDVPPIIDFANKTVGMRLGGPIIKNKLFFFVTGEYEDRSTPTLTWKATRAGVASDANTSRTPLDSLNLLSRHLNDTYNYQTGKSEGLDNFKVNNYKVLGRIDWNISKQHSLSLRYNTFNNEDDQILNGTSNPASALPNNRWSQNAMSYENSNYGFKNKVDLFAAEVKSNFNSAMSNQLVVTFTKENAERTSKSKLFPFIDINVGPNFAALGYANATNNYLSAGYELFTPQNIVDNNTLNINNNFTYNVGKHSITAGIGYEKIDVANSFYRFGTSYYRYASLSDFLTNKAPVTFGYTYATDPNEQFVKLNFAQASIYAQDEVRFTDNFKFTYGLRVDKPFFNNELKANSTVDAINFKDLNGNNLNIATGKWPKEKTYFSPRIGFNWDIEGDKMKVLRGGVGLFTGRFPFVWFTNQPSNSYTTVRQYSTTTGADLNNFLFNPNPNAYRNAINALPNPITNLATIDPNFKMPQVLRISAGYDQKLKGDWNISFDAIYNKDINNLLYYNANQRTAVGTMFGVDNRPVFGTDPGTNTAANNINNPLRRINTSISDAMVLTNTKKGGGFIFTAQIAKRFSNNWDFSFAYTHTIGTDISGNPGATANSAWNNIPSAVGNNALQLANNDFATPHRILAYGSYKLNWSKYTGTTFSLIYTGFTQGRFSYTVTGDINNDGISNSDLMYIPKNAGEITFANIVNSTTNAVIFTAQQQSDAFFAYVDQDKYLSRNKGRYAARNGAKLPFFGNLDFRILQDILPFKNNKRRGLQLSVEIENFTNFLNNDWGIQKRTTLNNSRLLSVATGGTPTAAPTYRLNLVNGQLPTRSFESVVTTASTWRMNLGVRLNF